jgi:hypothetical protein
MAALAVSRWLERETGSEHQEIREDLRRYHTVTIQVGDQTIAAADPVPAEAQQALTRLRDAGAAH